MKIIIISLQYNMEELIKPNQEESVESVEEATRDQYLCDKWFAKRKTRLTSSRFG